MIRAQPSGRRRAYDGRPMRVRTGDLVAGIAAWTRRWNAILPLLAAELIVWLGFGALLPIMPLYFTEHGVDLVDARRRRRRVAGRPPDRRADLRLARRPDAARAADGRRQRPGRDLPVPAARVRRGRRRSSILRAVAGLATAMYDPAARGYITDATPAERRGEAFGLYGAAQMGGLLLGPAIGGIGATIFGGVAFIFVFGAISSFLAAAAIAIRVRERPHAAGRLPGAWSSPRSGPQSEHLAARALPATRPADAADDWTGPATPDAPASLVNRWLVAAILFTIGSNFAFGTYEVVWSIFLQRPRRRSRADRPDVRDVRPARSSSSRRSSAGGSIAAA